MLKPHEQRVVDEHATLVEKLEKLYDFFETTLFKSLTEKDGARLSHQAHHMQAYADILQARIRDFDD